MKEILAAALTLHDKKMPHIVATLIKVRGEAPSDLGNKMIVTREGLFAGTIGGGKIEARSIEYSKALLQDPHSPKAVFETWNLQTDIKMTCGGEVTVLFETVRPQHWKIAVFGAGHVAQALVRVLCHLDCQVQCTDMRQEWVGKLEDHPRLTKAVHTSPRDLVASFDPQTFILCMTQGHAFDVPILEAAMKMPFEFPYIGVIGSAQKGMRIKSDLKALGVDLNRIEKLRCPIGLKIGSSDPEEIAISVTAELMELRDRLRNPSL